MASDTNNKNDDKTLSIPDHPAPTYDGNARIDPVGSSNARRAYSARMKRQRALEEATPGQQATDQNPPSYTNIDHDSIVPVQPSPSSPSVQPDRVSIDLEAGQGRSVCNREELPPGYRVKHNAISPASFHVLESALADRATRKTADESPYYVPRSTFDPFEWATHAQPPSFPSGPTATALDRVNPSDPGTMAGLNDYEKSELLLIAYFDAIKYGMSNLVVELLESGLVDANVGKAKNYSYMKMYKTPLIAAVQNKQYETARILLEHGAAVDGWGIIDRPPVMITRYKTKQQHVLRTPLHLASAEGQLPFVKLLMEESQADDSLVSPSDGQTALRLAADAKHRDVVSFLPARRGGTTLRWRTKWRRTVLKLRSAAEDIAGLVKAIFWNCPVWLFKCLIRDPICWMWKERRRFPAWLGRTLRKIPAALAKLPRELWSIAQDIWRFLVRFVKAIPGVCKIVAKHCWSVVRSIGSALGRVANRAMSFMHTTVVAVATFFRQLTWANVYHGFKQLIQAIINLPSTLWQLLKSSWCKLYEIMEKLFGLLGEIIWCLATVLWYIVTYIPKKLWKMLVATGDMFGNVFKEGMIWWDPKRI